MNFDLGNACLAFINGMDMVGNMIEQGQIDYGIVVNGESSAYSTEKTIEKLLDPEVDEETFRSNFATLTLGSGAAAMVLGRSDLEPDGHTFTGSVNLAATQHCRLCAGNIDHMVTKTRELLMAGMELAVRTWGKATEALGWTADTVDHFVLHQVSKVHTEQLAGILGIDLAKIFRIYPDFGNIGPAGLPIALSKLLESGRLVRGQRVALLGIGSGINCTMAELLW
jgi:3-oxoacyl-[acyl-carrier-protein] synthase-3